MSDREKLIELLDTNFGYVDEVKAETLADRLIAAGVTVRREGQWIRDYTYTGKHKQRYVCSLCTHFQMNKRSYKDTCALYMNYCPQCGAKMDGGNSDAR